MSDSDAPLFRNRPVESPAEEPLGLKNPLLPARSLGLNQRFLVPLGARSLSVLDASIFQSDGIQRDFLDSPFQDSPFFSDADLTPVSVGSQEPKKQNSIQLQRSSTTSTNLTAPETQVLRDAGVPQSEMQEQRSPAETQQSASKPDIQRSLDKISAPSFDNISKSSDQPQQSTYQLDNPALSVETLPQISPNKNNQSSFSEASQITASQPSIQLLKSEPDIQLSQEKISIPSSKNISETLIQPQELNSQSNELDFKPESQYQVTPSQSIQRSTSSESEVEVPRTSQSSDLETQLLQETSFKQSSDSIIQPQKLSSQTSSSEIDNSAIKQTKISEDNQLCTADDINLKSSQSTIQPSRSQSSSTSEIAPTPSISDTPAIASEAFIQPARSPSSSESLSLNSTQPVHNVDIAEQPNSELSTSNLEQVVPSNDVSPIQQTSEHDEIALATSAEHPANSLLQTENEIIQSKIIVSDNSANDEISTNIDNTFQQSVSNAIASPLPLHSTITTSPKRQLENNESVLQRSPISAQAQIVETTEIESKLTDAIQKTELIETNSSLGQTLESVTTPTVEQFAISNEAPTVQAAKEPAIREPLAKLSTRLSTGIAPKFDLQSIENSEATKSSLDSIKTENLNSSATVQTHPSNLEDSSSSQLSTAFISDSSVPNQLSESALFKSSRWENAPTVQPQLAENDTEEITQLAPPPSPSSETLEVIETNARSLAEPTISLQPATQDFSSAERVNSPIDTQFSLDSLDQTVANSTSSLPSDTLTEPTQPALETTKSMLQPQLEMIAASDELSSSTEQLSSDKIAISTEAIAEKLPDANDAIAPLVSKVNQEVNPVISRALDLPPESANPDPANAAILLETSSENQTELLQLKALSENTNSQDTNLAQALNKLPAAISIAPSDLIVQKLQFDNNETVQKTSEIGANQPVISTGSTEVSDRATNQNFPETIIEQSSSVDLNASEIVNSVAPKDSLQARASIHEPLMIDVSESALSFGNAPTQAPIDQSGNSEAPITQTIQRSPQPSLTPNADSIAAESVVNLGTNQVDEVASQFTQADTFQHSNTINQANLQPETASILEETIQRKNQQSLDTASANAEIITQQVIQNSQTQADSEQSEIESVIQRSPILEETIQQATQQSEIESINLEEKTQQVILGSQSQLESEQSEIESVIQRSPTSENTAIASSTQPQIIQVETSELSAPQSDFASVEESDLASTSQTAMPQITSESSVNQVIDLKRDDTVQADVANLMQPNINAEQLNAEQPATIVQAKSDIQPNQATDDRTPSAIDIQPLVPKATIEPAEDQRSVDRPSVDELAVVQNPTRSIDIDSSTEKIQRFVDNHPVDDTAIAQHLTNPNINASATLPLNQQVNFEQFNSERSQDERSQIIDIAPTNTPSIQPSEHLFDRPSSIPEPSIQRSSASLESLDTKPNSPALELNQPDSIPQLPQVLQNLTVLRSLTQPQPLAQPLDASDTTVQAKSLQSQSLQAAPLQATNTPNLPLISAIPTANVPAALSLEQSVLNRKPEPVKVASTSSDRSRQWSTLNELVQGQTTPTRRGLAAKTAPSQKLSPGKANSPTIQAKFSESSTPVRVTRQTSPTIRRQGDDQDEDVDDVDYLETLAQAIYDRLRQRMRIEQERHGRDYSGRLPW